MREIKFRAWDKKNKSMGHVYSMTVDKRKDFARFSNVMMRTVYGKNRWFYRGDVILLQYTGLKDKNGKEIYEGDIVEDQFEDSFMKLHNISKRKYLVIYQEGCFMLSYNGKKVVGNQSDIASSLLRSKEVVVIGNIYENPKLLKDK